MAYAAPMTETPAPTFRPVLDLAVGDHVLFDGGTFVVERVGRGMKQRSVTYRPAGGRSDDTFTITHDAGNTVEVPTPAAAEVEEAPVLTPVGAVRVGDLITEVDTPAGPFYRVVRNVPGLLTIATDEADPLVIDLPTGLSSAVLVLPAPPADVHPAAALTLF